MKPEFPFFGRYREFGRVPPVLDREFWNRPWTGCGPRTGSTRRARRSCLLLTERCCSAAAVVPLARLLTLT
jgi:hypothetical protein